MIAKSDDQTMVVHMVERSVRYAIRREYVIVVFIMSLGVVATIWTAVIPRVHLWLEATSDARISNEIDAAIDRANESWDYRAQEVMDSLPPETLSEYESTVREIERIEKAKEALRELEEVQEIMSGGLR